MIVGLVVAGIGAIITWTTHEYASSHGGGKYFVFWGAVVFGLYQAFRGLLGWIENRPSRQ
jgi:hypothetical protein